MTAARKHDLVSIDEYLAGEIASDVKHEYLGGVVYAMAGGCNAHNLIAGNVFAACFQGGQLRTGKLLVRRECFRIEIVRFHGFNAQPACASFDVTHGTMHGIYERVTHSVEIQKDSPLGHPQKHIAKSPTIDGVLKTVVNVIRACDAESK